jgi:hypothetical protein
MTHREGEITVPTFSDDDDTRTRQKFHALQVGLGPVEN